LFLWRRLWSRLCLHRPGLCLWLRLRRSLLTHLLRGCARRGLLRPWLLPHLRLLRRNHPRLTRWLILWTGTLLALHRRLRSHLLLLWSGTHGRRALYFQLAALLSLCLDLLLRGRMTLLLRSNHLLPGSRPLYLLFLAQSVSLALLLLHLLTHTFALRVYRDAGAAGSLLLDLLPPQTLHLLPRVTITTGRLPGQIRHLSFSRLLCSYVRLRTRIAGLRTVVSPLLAGGPTLICDLKFLVP
jgi:hypothetical protein